MPLTADMLTPHLIGAMVRWDAGFEPEYGLVSSYTDSGTVFVRYGLGDTPEGCKVNELVLCAQSMTDSDRDAIYRAIENSDLHSRVSLTNLVAQIIKILLHS